MRQARGRRIEPARDDRNGGRRPVGGPGRPLGPLAAAGNRALQRVVVQRAEVNVKSGAPHQTILTELYDILKAAEDGKGKPRLGEHVNRLEDAIGLDLTREGSSHYGALFEETKTTATTAPDDDEPEVKRPRVVKEDEENEATTHVKVERVDEEEEERGAEPIATLVPPLEPATTKSKGQNKRKRGASTREKNDTHGMSLIEYPGDELTAPERQVLVEGSEAIWNRLRPKAVGLGAGRQPDKMKRVTGLHSEMAHVTDATSRGAVVKAVVSSQENCLLCYGYLELNKIEHGRLKEIKGGQAMTPKWRHGPMGFQLQREGNDTTTFPTVELKSKYGSKTYRLVDYREGER